jgi:hypothetical protein
MFAMSVGAANLADAGQLLLLAVGLTLAWLSLLHALAPATRRPAEYGLHQVYPAPEYSIRYGHSIENGMTEYV